MRSPAAKNLASELLGKFADFAMKSQNLFVTKQEANFWKQRAKRVALEKEIKGFAPLINRAGGESFSSQSPRPPFGYYPT